MMKGIKVEINHSLYCSSDISSSENKVVTLTDLKQGGFLGVNVRKCEKLSLNVFG